MHRLQTKLKCLFIDCLTEGVGYGDIISRNNSERIFTVMIQFVGGFSYALIIASITSVITRRDMNAMKVTEQLDAVRSYVSSRA